MRYCTGVFLAFCMIISFGLMLSCMEQDYSLTDGFRVSGAVVRNVGTVTLKNTVSGEMVRVTGSGNFILPGYFKSGDSYSIAVESNPVDQACTVYNPSGTISGGDVNNVGVVCSTVSKQAKNSTLNVTSVYPSFVTPSAAGSINLTLGVAADVLITMTSSLGSDANAMVADTAVAYAQVQVDGSPMAQARATTNTSKTCPVTFSKVVTLQPGSHTIAPAYSFSGAATTMFVDTGISGILTATVLSTVPGYRRYTEASITGASMTSAAAGTYMDITGLNSSSGDLPAGTTVIGMLPLLEMRRSPLDSISIDLMSNSTQLMTGTLSSNPDTDYIPLTLFASESLSTAVTHALNARWMSVNPSVTLTIENSSQASLGGIIMSTVTAQSVSRPAVITYPAVTLNATTTTSGYEQVAANPFPMDTPSRLLVALTLQNTRNNTAGMVTSYAIAIDNVSTIIGETSVATDVGNGTMPVSIIATTGFTVPAGTPQVQTYVKTTAAGPTVLGLNAKLTVMRID